MEYSSACPWNRYKIEFKYISPYSGRVIDEIEVEVAANAQEAVDMVRRDYANMQDVCIDRVYAETATWDVTDEWD
nr:MAG TPA: hypothetical protein [Caudoviricetes sp.]